MKRIVTIIFFCCAMLSARAQVAVNIDATLPDASAMLDVKSTTKGMLVPRVTTTQRTTTIPNPADGLLVYDITTKTFWFYKSGTGWTEINTGFTLPYVGQSNTTGVTFLAINNSNGAALSGQAYGSGPGILGSSESGFGGTFSSTTGVALKTSGKTELNGTLKIIDGTQAAGRVLISDANGLASWSALAGAWVPNGANIINPNTGNVGIGISNTLITEKLHIGLGNIKLGTTAWSGAADNRVVKFGDADYVSIGETDADDRMTLTAGTFRLTNINGTGNVGIGTTGAPTARLEVAGNIKIVDGTQGSGKVLTSNAAGLANWATPAAILPDKAGSGFMVIDDGSLDNILDGQTYTIPVYNASQGYDDGNNINNTTHQYTVPVTGFYHFDASLSINNAVSTTNFGRLGIRIVTLSTTNATQYLISNELNTISSYLVPRIISASGSNYLAAGTRVSVEVYNLAGVNLVLSTAKFSGFRVY